MNKFLTILSLFLYIATVNAANPQIKNISETDFEFSNINKTNKETPDKKTKQTIARKVINWIKTHPYQTAGISAAGMALIVGIVIAISKFPNKEERKKRHLETEKQKRHVGSLKSMEKFLKEAKDLPQVMPKEQIESAKPYLQVEGLNLKTIATDEPTKNKILHLLASEVAQGKHPALTYDYKNLATTGDVEISLDESGRKIITNDEQSEKLRKLINSYKLQELEKYK